MRLALGWISLLAVLTAVYAPGLHGPFVFDDRINLVDNSPLHIKDLSADSLQEATLSGLSSNLGRPLSMLSFGINYALGGDDPYYFKLTNLAIHLLNVGLAGLLVLGLIRAGPALRVPTEKQQGFALIVAGIWALHPIQVTAVFYVVQRMTSLSALFTLLGLVLYVTGRRQFNNDARPPGGSLLIATAVLLCLPLAVLSKENGILMVAYAAVIEFFIFGNAVEPATRRRAKRIAVAILVTCVAATAAFLALSANLNTSAYEGRGQTIGQHLLTEGRVLSWYLRMIFLPDLSQLGLIHDDWTISTSLFEPPATTFAWTLITVLVLAGWQLRSRIPALGFGVAWFLAGHALESSIFPLELVFEHRNYLPSFGLILGAASLAQSAADRLKLRSGFTASLVALPVILAVLTASRSVEWRSVIDWSTAQAQRHPHSPANQYFLGSLYALIAEQQSDAGGRDEFFNRADALFLKALALNPTMGSAQIARIDLRAKLGLPVPDELVDSLHATLQAHKFAPTTEYAVVSLVMCAGEGSCKLSEAQVQKIVRLTVDSPYCSGTVHALLLLNLATYYGQVKRDDATALRYAREAVATPGAPLTSKLVLVRWLAESAHYDEALNVLTELDESDRLGQYRQKRSAWRKLIAERMREPQTR